MKPTNQRQRLTPPLVHRLLLFAMLASMVACTSYSRAGDSEAGNAHTDLPSSWSLNSASGYASHALGLHPQEQDPGAEAGHEHEGEHDHAHEQEQQGSHDTKDARTQHTDFVPVGYPAPLGTNLTRDWLAPWPHSHFSRLGTPFVHPFGLEPAYLDRDLIVDYRQARSPGVDESEELEAELEWALTRRLGIVVEGRVARVDAEGAPAESGLGDLIVAPRALLVDSERLLISFNLEGSFPTGDDERGLGEGQVGLAPSLAAWMDFGAWIQGDLQVGTEHGLESGDAVCFYNGALAWSFLGPAVLGGKSGQGHGHEHEFADLPAGLTSLIVEFTGRTGIRGADQGLATQELLFGISHSVSAAWELRFAYQIPIGQPEELDDGFVLGLIYHF